MKKSIKEHLAVIKRGVVEIISEDELIKKLKKAIDSGTPLLVKAGFDPTAPDIHLGHTVLMQKLKGFQELGHKVLFLIGDFTGMIGDPSGRSEIRKPLTREEVSKNSETYKEQVFKILDRDKTEIVYNSQWMDKLSAKDIIDLAARHTVARMLERNDFEERYKKGRPIGIHEFIYPLIQGYDSVALKADIELGGTDQKFNLLVGRELQRGVGQEPQVVITLPLLEGLDGKKKMSKSFNNYIGITEPPREIYGKIMSTSDSLMWRYYELLSDLEMEEIESLRIAVDKGRKNPKDVKVDLAKEIVERFYGKGEAKKAQDEFDRIFIRKGLPDDVPVYRFEKFLAIEEKGSKSPVWLPYILKGAGLTASTSEARRLVTQGAVSVNGEKVNDVDMDIYGDKELIIRVGKRRVVKVIP
ncbi:MAG: tyrosine--tRNA ligase [Thermodesulfobacteriota bacterium]